MTENAPDAVELLTRQHREMERLLEEICQADEAGRKPLFATVADQLTIHIKAEEQIFYPAVHMARTEDDLLEALEEHLSLKRLLADLVELEPDDRAFEPKFKVLKEQTEHHHREEEEHLFPAVLKLVGEQERCALGAQMLVLQAQLTRQDAPRCAVINETESAAPLD
ncbi:MAG TPA: hemerythrin domain-containing protein [Noviherbaspirillum sp.]|nr:hemerythrin domain-containing protein [Noviherbaspirillum sp.]